MEPTESKSIKESKELIKGVEVVGVAAVKIFADGKVNLADLPHLAELAKNLDVVIAGAEGAGEIPAEVKDLDQAELIELGTAAFALVKALKEAKNG